MKVAIAHAQFVPERIASVQRLHAQLNDPSSLTTFVSVRREPCWEWTRRIWEYVAASSEPVVCLDDDVQVGPDFHAEVAAVSAAAPGELVSLHVQAPGAGAVEGRWCRSYWLTGPAYLLPPHVARELLDFWDSLPWEVAARLNNDNVAIHHAWARQKPILTTLPALAMHDVTVPSSLGYDAHPFRVPSVQRKEGVDLTAPWPVPGDAVPVVENPWALPAALAKFRSSVRSPDGVCSVCMAGNAVIRFPGNVGLCQPCAKQVTMAYLGQRL
jgi:hypothetical protein